MKILKVDLVLNFYSPAVFEVFSGLEAGFNSLTGNFSIVSTGLDCVDNCASTFVSGKLPEPPNHTGRLSENNTAK